MEHYDWNDGWLFCPTFDPALVRPECTGLELEPVRIPHTVKALPYNYCNENDHQRLCGYRREFFAPAEWAGRTVLLTFGAIAHDATVFCNGRRLFHHGCGYTAFTVDLTSALHLGKKNVVAVRCDSREDLNIPPFGGSIDYLTYGGIYRAVSLDIKEPAYLRDVFVEARAEGDFRIYTATVGETVELTGKEDYIFVDVFDRITFDLNAGNGRAIATLVNGTEAEFSQPLNNGDRVEIYWKEK